MRLLVSPLLLCTALGTAMSPLWAEDEPNPRGMDVADAVRNVRKWLGPGTPPSSKPWANDLAALTDPDADVHAPAVRGLVIAGLAHPQEVLKDLATVAEDPDWRVRARVAQVLHGIGGEAATPLALTLSKDREARLRELCALALGRCRGDGVLPRLIALLGAPESGIREAAAAGLATLGDHRALTALAGLTNERDDLVRREMQRALVSLLNQSAAIPEAARLLKESTGDQRDALLETVTITADRRLCPVLTDIAANPGAGGTPQPGRDPSAWTQFLALRALTTCGDLRACGVLIAIADGQHPAALREQAAATLRVLTGYQAQPGKAWRVWWVDHEPGIARLAAREAFIAGLHDTGATPDRQAIAGFSVDDLTPLVDAVLGVPAGRLAPWFPGQALAALRADSPARWTALMGQRCRSLPSRDLHTRLGLALLIDDLGGPDAGRELQAIATDLATREKTEKEAAGESKVAPPDHGPLRRALNLGLERRGLPPIQ